MDEPSRKPIHHPLPDPGRWPTAEKAAASRLFSPAQLGPRRSRTRTWIPAMVPWRASEDGEVTDDVLDWYGRFARGKPGVLVVEATGIRDQASGPLLRIGHDRYLPGLRSLVERVREESEGLTLLLIQIIDFLRIARRPTPERYFERYLVVDREGRERWARILGEPDLVDCPDEGLRARLLGMPERWEELLDDRQFEALQRGYRERVTDLHLPEIRELPRVLPGLFAAAAERAVKAGFDGVELHYAHAYTMASFLSARNTRDDGYGGSLEGRLRLPLEVISAAQKAVAERAALGCRFLGEEAIPQGSSLEDACHFGVAFARAGLDFLSVSKGGKFEDARQPKVGEAAYPYTGPSGHECMPTVRSDERGPFGRNLPLAAAIRAAVREAGFGTPIVTAGGLCHFEQCEEVLSSGTADFVGAARQSLADPDWWLKMEVGAGDRIRRCSFTNYCEGLDQRHKQVTCRLWDRMTDEGASIPLARDGRRRLVAPDWNEGRA